MALQSSGTIALSDVNVELGNTSTDTINLNSTEVRGLFGIGSGIIRMQNGHGKSSSIAPTVTGGTVNITAVNEQVSTSYDVGNNFTFAPGHTLSSFSVQSGSLPTGLSLNATSGVISGTMGNVSSNTSYNFTIRGTNITGTSADQGYGWAINTVAPGVAGGVITVGAVQEGLSASYDVDSQFTFTTGSAFSTYSLVSGTLPSGLSLNTSTGVISGTMGAVSSTTAYSFSIRGTDTDGDYVDQSYSWTINNQTPTQALRAAIVAGQNVTNWNLAGITDMSNLFQGVSGFNQDISGWDVSGVTNMYNMFNGASSFNQNISGWDVSNVTNMARMFYYASAFNQNISGWNMTSVENIQQMFAWTANFNQPIGSWNTSNINRMYGVFYRASAFNHPINSWNTSNVTNMSEMFSYAYSFNQPIGGWDTSKVTEMAFMFLGTGPFNQSISGWNTAAVTKMGYMFYANPNFNQNISGWNVSSVTWCGEFRSGGAGISCANTPNNLSAACTGC